MKISGGDSGESISALEKEEEKDDEPIFDSGGGVVFLVGGFRNFFNGDSLDEPSMFPLFLLEELELSEKEAIFDSGK